MDINILQGDALEVLKKLPNKSVNCVVTSPPYWALRSYLPDEHIDKKKELGLEENPNDYIMKLCDIFDEVKRVLRDDGTCWVNLGDTYYTKSGGKFENDTIAKKNKEQVTNSTGINKANELRGRGFLPEKSLANIPARFSIEMQKRGWTLRNHIIWKKDNVFPTSVKDRFTVDYESVFFFVKNKNYWFEQQFETLSDETIKDIGRRTNLVRATGEKGSKHFNNKNSPYNSAFTNRRRDEFVDLEKGRNKRTVWHINTKPYSESHFAVFPEKLVETPIKAGCPVGGVVMDIFMGSGTVGVVALRQNKKFIGIDLNSEYIKIAEKRIKNYKEKELIYEDGTRGLERWM